MSELLSLNSQMLSVDFAVRNTPFELHHLSRETGRVVGHWYTLCGPYMVRHATEGHVRWAVHRA